MSDTLLFDLPDELLIRCLAGSGGQGIACAAVACSRLLGLANRLRQLPVFSSAASTLPSLQHAIRDAGQRALTGCYGAVDFALLFVANYGNARGKKYNDPNDLAHSVDMLREVLGQDVVIVGCACAGLMGVGPDSQPVEVDPQSNTSRGRAAAAEAKRAGRSPPPTKGVSVLLGKLPPGCVARAFAQEVMEGPAALADPDTPPAGWSWPLLDEALALTSSQKAALAQQLASLAPTAAQHTAAGAAAGRGSRMDPCTAQGGASAAGASPVHQQPAAQAAAELGASPETAAAAEGLLSVVAAVAAAAAEPASGAGGADDVVLVPQLCLMLYDSSLQSFGYTESPDMERALTHLAAKGVLVTGGASSGAGDLFFSPGADGRRVTGEPSFTNNPQIVGLLLCTARAPVAPAAAAAAASTAQAPALAAASPAGPLDLAAAVRPAAGHTAVSKVATGREAAAAAAAVSKGSSIESQTAAAAAAGWLDSSASLHTSACAALGLGPSEQGPLFTDVRAKIAYSHALSVNHLAVQLQVDRCGMVAPPAQAAPAPGQQQDATAAEAAVTAATTDAAGDSVSPAPPAASQAATGDTAAAAAADSAAVRRSARLAAAATPGGGQSAPVALTPLHHLYAAVSAGAPVALFDDDEDDSGQYLAVWVCGQGDSPAAFTGDEAQVAICELLACELESRAGPVVPGSNSHSSSNSNNSSSGSSGSDYIEITAAVHVSSYASLRDIISSAPPGSSLCCQVVGTKGAACARTIRRCLSQMLPALHHHTPATTSTATAAGATRNAAAAAAGGGRCGGSALAEAEAAAACRGPAGVGVVVGAGRAMSDCYDALSRGAAASGARSGLAGVAVCCCTGRGQALYAEGVEGASAFGAVSEAQIVDAVGRAGVPFVGAYVSGELGPEVRHMCSGWFKRDGVSGGVDAAEMQGFTSIFAGWGCLPGVA